MLDRDIPIRVRAYPGKEWAMARVVRNACEHVQGGRDTKIRQDTKTLIFRSKGRSVGRSVGWPNLRSGSVTLFPAAMHIWTDGRALFFVLQYYDLILVVQHGFMQEALAKAKQAPLPKL